MRDVAIKLRERREFKLRLYDMRGGEVDREYCQSVEKVSVATETLGWMKYRGFVRSLSEVTEAICPL